MGSGRFGQPLGPSRRHLLEQCGVPIRGRQQSGELVKQVAIDQRVLAGGQRSAEDPPAKAARLRFGRKVTAVEQIPRQQPPVQEVLASDQTSQIPTRAEPSRISQAKVPRPVENICAWPAISSTINPREA